MARCPYNDFSLRMNRPFKSTMAPEALELVAARFKLLGEPLRLRILQQLDLGEKSVTELTAIVGSTQPNVSKHLKVLQEAGLVGRRQEGNVVYCFIADPAVFDLCNLVCSSIQARLDAQARTFNPPPKKRRR